MSSVMFIQHSSSNPLEGFALLMNNTVNSAGSCTPETSIPGTRTEVQLRAEWELDSITHHTWSRDSPTYTLPMLIMKSILLQSKTSTQTTLCSFKNSYNSEWVDRKNLNKIKYWDLVENVCRICFFLLKWISAEYWSWPNIKTIKGRIKRLWI